MNDAPSSQSQTVDGPPPEFVDKQTRDERVIDAWFVETFHNLGLPTDLQNRLSAARERLKALLRAKES